MHNEKCRIQCAAVCLSAIRMNSSKRLFFFFHHCHKAPTLLILSPLSYIIYNIHDTKQLYVILCLHTIIVIVVRVHVSKRESRKRITRTLILLYTHTVCNRNRIREKIFLLYYYCYDFL